MYRSVSVLIAGVIVSLIGSTWLLFASYRADRREAHIATFYLPMRFIKIVIEHPKECLAPFVVQSIGFVLSLTGIFILLSHIQSLKQ